MVAAGHASPLPFMGEPMSIRRTMAGLAQALRAQGRRKDAAGVEARLAKAWTSADVKATASSF